MNMRALKLRRNLIILKGVGGEAGLSKSVQKMLVLDLPLEPALISKGKAAKGE